MNDRQIDYFMAVATNLSFTKTSEELFVSQPAISKQISQLEKELGARLFIRSNQKTELTEVGKLYFNLFSRYKDDFINTRIEADRILGRTQGTMKVGFLEGWDLSGIIPPMISMFNDVYPDIEVIINCCGVKELNTSLLTDNLDIIVTMNNSVGTGAEFNVTDVAEVGKILLFSTSHHLAGRKGLSLRDFSEDTFIAPWEIVDKMIIEQTSTYTKPYGFIPRLRFVKNHESTITCVRNNMGVTIADEWVWAKNADDIEYMPFRAADTVSVLRRKTKEDAATLLMESILTEVITGQDQAGKDELSE